MNGAQLVELKGKWCAQHGKKGISSPRWWPEDWIADGAGVAETGLGLYTLLLDAKLGR
jgi:hypothetical protein